jgi:TetR/AcrR family transcriptional repressor of nem operon
MVRPRQFDTQTATDQAMHVFRKQGYKGSSLLDLTAAMGISKSSFYETFGSKHALFLTTLNRFHQTKAIYQIIDQQSGISAKTMITNIFKQLIDNVSAGTGGCMFGDCAIEFSNTDQAVTNQISDGIKQLEHMFYQILMREQEQGRVSKNFKPRTMARQLTATFYGLQVMANANLDRETLNDITSSAVAILD